MQKTEIPGQAELEIEAQKIHARTDHALLDALKNHDVVTSQLPKILPSRGTRQKQEIRDAEKELDRAARRYVSATKHRLRVESLRPITHSFGPDGIHRITGMIEGDRRLGLLIFPGGQIRGGITGKLKEQSEEVTESTDEGVKYRKLIPLFNRRAKLAPKAA
ncbi:hypothetical protein HZA75_03140 [Candidatus Roizmanbacteria bacterium]|nr:hypothetical protein [Candidatus Roizmanbacteria bacterium]